MDSMASADRPELDPLSAALFARQTEFYCVELSLGRVTTAEVRDQVDAYALRLHIQTCGKEHAPLPGVTRYDEDIADRL